MGVVQRSKTTITFLMQNHEQCFVTQTTEQNKDFQRRQYVSELPGEVYSGSTEFWREKARTAFR